LLDLIGAENRHVIIAKINGIDLGTGTSCSIDRHREDTFVIGLFAETSGKR
jgi:hypothetical protein